MKTSKRDRRDRARRNERGFSMIEMLIVISVILILAAATVALARPVIQYAHESSAVSTLKTTVNANNHYREFYPSIGYAALAANLGTVQNAGCPDTPDPNGLGACMIADGSAAQLDKGTLAGYNYLYTPVTTGSIISSWTLTATPASSGDGRRAYIVDSSGAISYNNCANGGTWSCVAPTTVAAGTPIGK